jgi:hypothetical protein
MAFDPWVPSSMMSKSEVVNRQYRLTITQKRADEVAALTSPASSFSIGQLAMSSADDA